MIMGSGPRLRTCVELVDHGVDAAGHAPAITDEHDHLTTRLHPSAPFDPWQPYSAYFGLEADPFADAFAEAREA